MYENIYRDNTGILWRWAMHYRAACVRRADLELDDLVQVGFFGLVEAKETYQEEKGSWYGWASLYVRKHMREALGLGRKKPLETLDLDAPLSDELDGDTLGDMIADENAPDIDAQIIRTEVVRAVREAVKAIQDEAARNAVQRVYLDEKTRPEAAAALDVEETKLSALLRKGCNEIRKNKQLRKMLPDLDEMTRFHAKKSIRAFNTDHTSVVEAAVIWREEHKNEFRK